IFDPRGHADFGGEVERFLKRADGVLMLVDAAEGTKPQTRFVLRKALECKLKPVVVINKIDRPDARPSEALSETFDLFVELGADDDTLDFPFIFASGRAGFATHDPSVKTDNIYPLLAMVLEHDPGPEVNLDAPLQLMITTLAWSDYVGRIATGRIASGKISKGQRVAILRADGSQVAGQAVAVEVFDKLGRTPVDEVTA